VLLKRWSSNYRSWPWSWSWSWRVWRGLGLGTEDSLLGLLLCKRIYSGNDPLSFGAAVAFCDPGTVTQMILLTYLFISYLVSSLRSRVQRLSSLCVFDVRRWGGGGRRRRWTCLRARSCRHSAWRRWTTSWRHSRLAGWLLNSFNVPLNHPFIYSVSQSIYQNLRSRFGIERHPYTESRIDQIPCVCTVCMYVCLCNDSSQTTEPICIKIMPAFVTLIAIGYLDLKYLPHHI